MPSLIFAAGGGIETSLLPFYLLRMRAQYENLSIRVALSPGAQQFVTTTAIRGATRGEPYTENVLFDDVNRLPMHLSVATADLLVIYPATPRILAECAIGSITCPVTRTFAFFKKQNVIVTPFLHPDLDHRLYVRHLDTLTELGCTVLRPTEGSLSWESGNAWSSTERAICTSLNLERLAQSRTFQASRN
ncbi:hypothetical protein C0Z18_28565 [Trinickia dabaoshanensis]|uniref:Flavoprotein domain-containing protein n=1 Tax=Trinickia dabaoshanensis TaxID=564714 RepID=A0A2N7VD90_9BURK|nr:flavoprotein [Trinickia dabaoshanensis]PMS15119.1 hypothetical protein C0Z18_28565 [Trinickia dabaoshanensis]